MVLTFARLAAVVLSALQPILTQADELTDEAPTSVAAGVYTSDQAKRGERIYPSVCGRCHGQRLDGAPEDPDMLPAPPIAGPKFLRSWEGATLAALFELTRTTMPAINPGSLADQEFADIVGYMLAASGFPAGDRELPPDPVALSRITIEQAH